MAHETVHAKAGRNPIRFRKVNASLLEGRQDILEHLEDRANEGLVDLIFNRLYYGRQADGENHNFL